MTTEICKLLSDTEEKYGVEILYACESGSRAWGFASPDSDYDIRFIFKHPESAYLKVGSPVDIIEIPIEDDLDPGGWDVRKALSLLRKSNGALTEWLHSPIVYKEADGFLDEWRSAYAEIFSPKALYDHYRGLAKQMWKSALVGDAVRAKSYLYCLRASLAAMYVADRKCPAPVEFEKLLDYLPKELHSVIDDLLEYKADSGEKQTMERIASLDAFLEKAVDSDFPPGMERPPVNAPVLDRLFKNTVRANAPLMKKKDFTLARVRQKDLLLFEAVGGSKAYGTNMPESDEDLRGLFAAPTSFLTGAEGIEQVQDEKGDEVYYELGRFFELLTKCNPNALEVLFIPDDCVRYKHPVFDLIDPRLFLTKQCELSFGGYALGQVKKARGLNKKIVNPEPEVRKELRDFSHVLCAQGSVSLTDWLASKQIKDENCGLVAVNHAPNTYAIFDGKGEIPYRGMFSKSGEPDVLCSSVPKGEEPLGWVVCNVDAYKRHIKLHKEYWNWVKKRNESRYLVNSEHGRGYDSKNMMHTLRLLEIAEMIAKEGAIQLRSPNVDFLMQVRRGEFAYGELLKMAEDKMESITAAYAECSLPDVVDFHKANEMLMEVREAFR